MAFIPKKRNQPEIVQNPKAVGGMRGITTVCDPDSEHTLHLYTSTRIKQALPCEKTEEEIDRMWSYLKMMGRG